MEIREWDNTTSRDPKLKQSEHSYGLGTKSAAFLNIKSHTVHYGDHQNPNYTVIYIVCATLDAQLAVY